MNFGFSNFRSGRAAVAACVVAMIAAVNGLANGHPEIVVAVGAAGDSEYAEGFAAAASAWRDAAGQAGARCTVVGLDEPKAVEHAPEAPAADAPADAARLREALDRVSASSIHPLWLIYLGHGTWDGREARLNLEGPDVTPAEVAQWLERFERPIVFVHGGSASGPFLPALSAPHRIIITATENGDEVNYARFGERFARAIASPGSDIDQDGQVSVLEAFLSAAQQTQLFYTEAGRMATEHALIDDNGDRRGTPAEWFTGTRATTQAQDGAAVDGAIAHRVVLVESAAERALTPKQRERRDALEQELDALRARKASMPESNYLHELERVLRQLSEVYLAAPEPPPAPPAVPTP